MSIVTIPLSIGHCFQTVSLPVRGFDRLQSQLMSRDGQLAVQYRVREQGQYTLLELIVTGRLKVACQRCLESMEMEVDKHVSYQLINDELLPMDSEQAYEQVVVVDDKVDLNVIVEDELLLGLPIKHTSSCLDVSFSESHSTVPLKRPGSFDELKALLGAKSVN